MYRNYLFYVRISMYFKRFYIPVHFFSQLMKLRCRDEVPCPESHTFGDRKHGCKSKSLMLPDQCLISPIMCYGINLTEADESLVDNIYI